MLHKNICSDKLQIPLFSMKMYSKIKEKSCLLPQEERDGEFEAKKMAGRNKRRKKVYTGTGCGGSKHTTSLLYAN
ncbi:hypothetical protein ADA01nite_40730 [Aneurinibacillus danicus]|uniref:Uncharacterized protein n=1 Tax=Aneurinibacillus danicus TaxID=267746 RepID=A0A511VGE0_9BACL|nr:hypothetical protein ADA01nite_40730 [Aneurinibacillus danicus]